VSILYLAHMMDRLGKDPESGIGGLLPPFLLVASGCLLIFLQNDLSTAAIAALAAMVLFLVGGASISFFIGIGAVALPLAALSILTSDFRLRRILAFLYPAYEPHGQGYQILGSIRAIQSGGFFGKGLGLGTLKVGSVPEVQTDFIFAAWTEEMGFLGVIVFFALWGLFAWKCYRNAFREEEGFRSYLGFGLITLLLMEVLVNVAMASGAIPASGIPLPLFSSGGSSFLATFGIMGLLVNLSRPESGLGRAGRSDEGSGRAGRAFAGKARTEAPRGGDYV
jgi:cell division protein FtsW